MSISIGIIGYGAIGQSVHRILSEVPNCHVSGVLTREAIQGLQGAVGVRTLPDLLQLRHDVVIECAGQAALREYGPTVLEAGTDLVPASIGSLVDDAFRESMRAASLRGSSSLRLPSGAIVGIDGLAAARLVGVKHVIYRGTMAPSALKNFEGAAAITQQTLVYEGTARDAVSRFPKNANLTGTIALAGIGFDKTRVELILDPEVTSNIHELEVSGDFGAFHVKVTGNRISDTSPSSRIVPASLVQAALGSNYTLMGAVNA